MEDNLLKKIVATVLALIGLASAVLRFFLNLIKNIGSNVPSVETDITPE